MKVLVVDDELVSRKKLKKLMLNFSDCDDASDGQKGIEMFEKALKASEPYGLITLDIDMPNMDGFEALQKIKEIEKEVGNTELPAVKVLMVTGHSDKDNVVKAIKLGCDNFIIKPFNKDKVFDKVKSIGIEV